MKENNNFAHNYTISNINKVSPVGPESVVARGGDEN